MGDEGIVYILTNKSMPYLVKIGHSTTKNFAERINRLYVGKSGVPTQFECFFACTIRDGMSVKEAEDKIHELFDPYRVNSKREFFKVDPMRAKVAFDLIKKNEVTPKEEILPEQEDERRAAIDAGNKMDRLTPFNFRMVGLKKDDEIYFNDKKTIKAKVVDNKRIEYKGDITSLSAAATKELGYKYTVQGPLYWMYDGETLSERRKRLGEEGYPVIGKPSRKKTGTNKGLGRNKKNGAEKKSLRKSSFRFSEVGLKKGDELHWCNDRNKKAQVYDDTKIRFEERVTTLSGSAKKLLNYHRSVQGIRYWMYAGETLIARKTRIEKQFSQGAGKPPREKIRKKPGKRQERFSFSKVGLEKGAKLYWYDDRNKKAYVYDDTKITFRGKVTTLSASATKELGHKYGVQGPRYWMYEGETLLERRKRMEEQS